MADCGGLKAGRVLLAHRLGWLGAGRGLFAHVCSVVNYREGVTADWVLGGAGVMLSS